MSSEGTWWVVTASASAAGDNINMGLPCGGCLSVGYDDAADGDDDF